MHLLYKPKYKRPVPKTAKRIQKDGDTYARWTNRQGKRVEAKIYTDKAGNEYCNVEISTFYARFLDSQGRVVKRNTLCTDRSCAMGVLNGWIGITEKVLAGRLHISEERKPDHKRGPVGISETLHAYLKYLRRKGRTEKHIDYCRYVVEKFREYTKSTAVVGIDRHAIQEYLNMLQDKNRSARCRNHHKTILSGFCGYSVREGHLQQNPVSSIESAEVALDRRHVRRALSDAEIVELLKAAAQRPLYDGRYNHRGNADSGEGTSKKPFLSTFDNRDEENLKKACLDPDTEAKLLLRGRERALIYEVLIITGLRWGELKQICTCDIEFDSRYPHIRVSAKVSKNKKDATVPLSPVLADKLANWIKDVQRIGRTRLFEMPDNGIRVFDRDLAYANIPKKTIAGIADIHSLRKTCATRLARNGVPIAVAQRILRHSDPKITMSIYAELGIEDMGTAMTTLPDLITSTA